jgi:hypothetical protein
MLGSCSSMPALQVTRTRRAGAVSLDIAPGARRPSPQQAGGAAPASVKRALRLTIELTMPLGVAIAWSPRRTKL